MIYGFFNENFKREFLLLKDLVCELLIAGIQSCLYDLMMNYSYTVIQIYLYIIKCVAGLQIWPQLQCISPQFSWDQTFTSEPRPKFPTKANSNVDRDRKTPGWRQICEECKPKSKLIVKWPLLLESRPSRKNTIFRADAFEAAPAAKRSIGNTKKKWSKPSWSFTKHQTCYLLAVLCAVCLIQPYPVTTLHD